MCNENCSIVDCINKMGVAHNLGLEVLSYFQEIAQIQLLGSLLRNNFRGLWLEVLISSISDAMDGQRRTTRSKCQKSTRVPSNLALFGHFFFLWGQRLSQIPFLRYYLSRYAFFEGWPGLWDEAATTIKVR